jgi:hypothetical protein
VRALKLGLVRKFFVAFPAAVLTFFIAGLFISCTSSASITWGLSHPVGDRLLIPSVNVSYRCKPQTCHRECSNSLGACNKNPTVARRGWASLLNPALSCEGGQRHTG